MTSEITEATASGYSPSSKVPTSSSVSSTPHVSVEVKKPLPLAEASPAQAASDHFVPSRSAISVLAARRLSQASPSRLSSRVASTESSPRFNPGFDIVSTKEKERENTQSGGGNHCGGKAHPRTAYHASSTTAVAVTTENTPLGLARPSIITSTDCGGNGGVLNDDPVFSLEMNGGGGGGNRGCNGSFNDDNNNKNGSTSGSLFSFGGGQATAARPARQLYVCTDIDTTAPRTANTSRKPSLNASPNKCAAAANVGNIEAANAPATATVVTTASSFCSPTQAVVLEASTPTTDQQPQQQQQQQRRKDLVAPRCALVTRTGHHQRSPPLEIPQHAPLQEQQQETSNLNLITTEPAETVSGGDTGRVCAADKVALTVLQLLEHQRLHVLFTEWRHWVSICRIVESGDCTRSSQAPPLALASGVSLGNSGSSSTNRGVKDLPFWRLPDKNSAPATAGGGLGQLPVYPRGGGGSHSSPTSNEGKCYIAFPGSISSSNPPSIIPARGALSRTPMQQRRRQGHVTSVDGESHEASHDNPLNSRSTSFSRFEQVSFGSPGCGGNIPGCQSRMFGENSISTCSHRSTWKDDGDYSQPDDVKAAEEVHRVNVSTKEAARRARLETRLGRTMDHLLISALRLQAPQRGMHPTLLTSMLTRSEDDEVDDDSSGPTSASRCGSPRQQSGGDGGVAKDDKNMMEDDECQAQSINTEQCFATTARPNVDTSKQYVSAAGVVSVIESRLSSSPGVSTQQVGNNSQDGISAEAVASIASTFHIHSQQQPQQQQEQHCISTSSSPVRPILAPILATTAAAAGDAGGTSPTSSCSEMVSNDRVTVSAATHSVEASLSTTRNSMPRRELAGYLTGGSTSAMAVATAAVVTAAAAAAVVAAAAAASSGSCGDNVPTSLELPGALSETMQPHHHFQQQHQPHHLYSQQSPPYHVLTAKSISAPRSAEESNTSGSNTKKRASSVPNSNNKNSTSSGIVNTNANSNTLGGKASSTRAIASTSLSSAVSTSLRNKMQDEEQRSGGEEDAPKCVVALLTASALRAHESRESSRQQPPYDRIATAVKAFKRRPYVPVENSASLPNSPGSGGGGVAGEDVAALQDPQSTVLRKTERSARRHIIMEYHNGLERILRNIVFP